MNIPGRRTVVLVVFAMAMLGAGSAVNAASASAAAVNPTVNGTTVNGTAATGTVLDDTVVNGVTGDSVATPCPPKSSSTAAADSSADRAVPALAVAAAPVTIWMAGDSTMQNPSGGCPVGWGSQFGALFNSDVTVVNRAVGGRSIQTWLYDPNVTNAKDSTGECVISPNTYSTRWQEMLNASTGMKAGDYLFIQFGINDGTSACPRHVGSARYQALLSMMAKAAQARGAHPVFLTPVAAITCSGSTATPNRGFATATFAAGTATNVPVIDLQKLSVALYNSLGFCPNNGDYTSGIVGAFFCEDHTHFETAGARQIATVVSTAVRGQVSELAAYLR